MNCVKEKIRYGTEIDRIFDYENIKDYKTNFQTVYRVYLELKSIKHLSADDLIRINYYLNIYYDLFEDKSFVYGIRNIYTSLAVIVKLNQRLINNTINKLRYLMLDELLTNLYLDRNTNRNNEILLYNIEVLITSLSKYDIKNIFDSVFNIDEINANSSLYTYNEYNKRIISNTDDVEIYKLNGLIISYYNTNDNIVKRKIERILCTFYKLSKEKNLNKAILNVVPERLKYKILINSIL